MDAMNYYNSQNLKIVAGRDTIIRDSSGLMIDVTNRSNGRLQWGRSNFSRLAGAWSWQDTDAVSKAA